MNKAILIGLLFLIPTTQLIAEEANDLEMRHLLAIAKFAGSCGLMSEMLDFQAKTKMDNGNEFVERFFAVETARLGRTGEEYFKECQYAITTYDKIWKVME